jgi:hypothetical protein
LNINGLYILAIFVLESGDTMGERMGRIRTDFFEAQMHRFQAKNKKKSVRIRPIRPIRSPIVSQNHRARSIAEKRFNDAKFDLSLCLKGTFKTKFRFKSWQN